jgi:hypothetical protein
VRHPDALFLGNHGSKVSGTRLLTPFLVVRAVLRREVHEARRCLPASSFGLLSGAHAPAFFAASSLAASTILMLLDLFKG